LNANLDAIEAAIENTISRDGTSPNQMEAVLDMNNQRIINLPEAAADNDPVRRIDLDDLEVVLAAGAALRANNLSDLTDAAEARTNLGADLAANVNYTPAGTGAVVTTLQAKARERVSIFDFMTTAQIADVQAGTLTLDMTDTIKAARDACLLSRKELFFPIGNYKLTDTILLNDTGSSQSSGFKGENRRYTIFTLYTASASTPAFRIGTSSNSSFIGGNIGTFTVVCNGGAAKGRGIQLDTTATNSAISQCDIGNITVLQTSRGLDVSGVVYMNTFHNITVTGSVTEYGIRIASAQEVIYNTLADCEVTGTESTAYSYSLQSPAMQGRNLTADGCIYISSVYGCFKGVTIEGIHAATTVSGTAIELNQCDSIEDISLVNIPTAKCPIAISVNGRCNITNVRWPDAGAGNQPDQPLYLSPGSKGVCIGYQVPRAVTSKVEAGSLAADVNNWVFLNSADITDRDLSYQENTWTPAFPGAEWSVQPTVVSASYVRIGRQITATVYAFDGVCSGGTIQGLPFACRASLAFSATGANSDFTERLGGAVYGGNTFISGFPGVTLTGNFWQMTVTYFI